MQQIDQEKVIGSGLGNASSKRFFFRLYISHENVATVLAIKNLKEICKTLGEEQCEVEIIDVHLNPLRAEKDRVFAIPTLIKVEPLPLVRILGDLRDSEKILSSFGCDA